nr:MAG TPA: hypothetical protein [Caudoviricetes sp.]
MFNWKGYVTEVARNVATVSSFIGAVCAFLEGAVLSGVLFVIIYALAATDAEWYYIPDGWDDDDDEDKKE